MLDEFDDIDEPLAAPGASQPMSLRGADVRRCTARLAARLFVAADVSLRARLLASLMKPLGALGIAGVAAGAFAWTLRRGAVVADAAVDLDRVASISSDQVLELARFAEQVNPQVLQDFVALIQASHLGLAAFSASAVLLLYRALPPTSPPVDDTPKPSR